MENQYRFRADLAQFSILEIKIAIGPKTQTGRSAKINNFYSI